MDIIEIVGLRQMDFVAQDGRPINGYQYFYLVDDPQVTGKMAGKLFISADAISSFGFLPKVGETVKAYYNRRGKVTAFEPV